MQGYPQKIKQRGRPGALKHKQQSNTTKAKTKDLKSLPIVLILLIS